MKIRNWRLKPQGLILGFMRGVAFFVHGMTPFLVPENTQFYHHAERFFCRARRFGTLEAVWQRWTWPPRRPAAARVGSRVVVRKLRWRVPHSSSCFFCCSLGLVHFRGRHEVWTCFGQTNQCGVCQKAEHHLDTKRSREMQATRNIERIGRSPKSLSSFAEVRTPPLPGSF